ncbi:hypothetical protein T05_4062 [Trichinella murrelli]|uniref:Uncharacterized protein n=1 Tax=Trichinella murrelli TaxID=144512 RepID=A0A0V0TDJ4_9BILA|nr:hypothetical protein T05_4062 [Trichinella murrelli]
MRGCPGKLCTNLDASQVIRTEAGCRGSEEGIGAGKQCLHQPRNGRVFSNVGAGPEHNVLQPFEEIPTTSGS